MSAQHTPGPWEAESTQNPNSEYMIWREIKACDSDGKTIALAEVFMDSALMEPTSEEARGNSYLMAAAPEMLSALYQYVSDLRYPPEGDSIERRIAAAEAVIAKARGDG